MPKRKAITRISGFLGSDDENVDVAHAPEQIEERPAKRTRGRPRSKSAEMKPPPHLNADTTAAAAPQPSDAGTKRSTRRGRPKGSRNSGQATTHDAVEKLDEAGHPSHEGAHILNEEIEESQAVSQPTRATKTRGATTRGRRKVSAEKPIITDGEFEYTPKSAKHQKSAEKPKERLESSTRQQRKSIPVPEEEELEHESAAEDVIEETVIHEETAQPRSISTSPSKRRQSLPRNLQSSPLKRKAEDGKTSGEPELRRRLGDLTKKYDTLENRYRNLKEIGIVEANANLEKLRKQCESMTTASNNLIASLKAEIDAQKALGQKSRSLQKQLREREGEVTQLTSQAEAAASQLSAAQTEVKALQTKLAAARNTAATLENATIKAPGSAIKGGAASRAQIAANAEAAHAAQFAQLKEDLYSDLTGLIIRDVKKREADNLYDCIQTGVNGTLHFKLAVPHVTSANFETAEFQYIPLLDENRDRELVDILPEYLTVDITFVRQQASKFYTRVIDALTKRRSSSAN